MGLAGRQLEDRLMWDIAWTVAAIASALLVLSGIAGVAVGGPAAAAGWWLIVVHGTLLVALLAQRRRRTA